MPDIQISDIIQQLQQAQQQANEANEARYNQALQTLRGGRETFRDLYGQAGSLISDIGQSAAEDINRGSERAMGQGQQSLINAGMANSTMMANLGRGVEEDRQRAMERVQEQQRTATSGLLRQQAQGEAGFSGNIADLITARTDAGPNAGLYSQLIQQASAAQQEPVQAALPANRTGGGGGFSSGSGFGSSMFDRGGGGGGDSGTGARTIHGSQQPDRPNTASIQSGLQSLGPIRMGKPQSQLDREQEQEQKKKKPSKKSNTKGPYTGDTAIGNFA